MPSWLLVNDVVFVLLCVQERLQFEPAGTQYNRHTKLDAFSKVLIDYVDGNVPTHLAEEALRDLLDDGHDELLVKDFDFLVRACACARPCVALGNAPSATRAFATSRVRDVAHTHARVPEYFHPTHHHRSSLAVVLLCSPISCAPSGTSTSTALPRASPTTRNSRLVGVVHARTCPAVLESSGACCFSLAVRGATAHYSVASCFCLVAQQASTGS